MGLFEEAGRRFERFKQATTSAAREGAEYACESCGARLYTDQDACPECGAEAVVAVESTDDEE